MVWKGHCAPPHNFFQFWTLKLPTFVHSERYFFNILEADICSKVLPALSTCQVVKNFLAVNQQMLPPV